MVSAPDLGKLISKVFVHKKILIIGAAALFAILLYSCKDDLMLKGDLTFHPTDFSKTPESVANFVTEEDLKGIENAGLKIYLGNNPPKIEGKYLLNNFKKKFDNMDWVSPFNHYTNYHYVFKNQTKDNQIDWDYKAVSVDVETDFGAAQKGYITGEGKCFTAFFEGKGENNECKYTAPQIISGCIEENGIKSYRESFLLKDKDVSKAECNDVNVASIGTLRLNYEADGLAQKE